MPLPPIPDTILSTMKSHGLRDTQPRRFVIGAMMKRKSPASAYDLQKLIITSGETINTVTVYRILDTLAELGLVHKEPTSGQYFLCSMPDTHGHHGFLHCDSCGKIEEFHNEDLCAVENKIAKAAGFTSKNHVSEISGICETCKK